jgi:hypothetical protein
MSTSFTDPASLGTVDSGDPCDFSSVAYDPIACANKGGGIPVDTGDACDPNSVAYDPVVCANGTPTGLPNPTGYDVTVDPAGVAWCQANPGMCDNAGPTALGLSKFCSDNPSECVTNPDGSQYYSPSMQAGPTSGGGTPGSGGNKYPGTGIKVPSVGSPGSGGILGGISTFFNSLGKLFTTCPAGYVKNAAGSCVKTGTAQVPASAGLLGGLNIGTVLLIGVVLVVLVKRKGA